jgi:hypothetical protein
VAVLVLEIRLRLVAMAAEELGFSQAVELEITATRAR